MAEAALPAAAARDDSNAAGLAADARAERLALFGLCSPALLLVMVVLIVPVSWLFYVSFIGADGSFSLENYERMLPASPMRGSSGPPSR